MTPVCPARINHLDDKYLLGPGKHEDVNDCAFEGANGIWTGFTVYNTNTICLIGGTLTAAEDMKFIVPDERRSFGLIPLRLQRLYNSLLDPNSKDWPTGRKWNQGNITDTQSLFSIVTPVKLGRWTVAELDAEGPRVLEDLLNTCKTSPVFLAIDENLYVVTTAVVNGADTTWKGFDISDPRPENLVSWTEKSLRAKAGEFTVLFNVAHQTLATKVEQRSCAIGNVTMTV